MTKVFTFILISVLLLIFLFPYYWSGIISIQKNVSIYNLKNLIPKNITLDNYRKLFRMKYFMRWNFNSLFTAFLISILVCIFSTMSGFVFAKSNIPGKNIIFWLFIITMAIPKQTILVPLFILVKDLGMINTYQGLILPPLAWPFGIFLMKQIIQTIPNSLIDAAKIDGANEWNILRKIIVPLIKPGIIALFLFTFVTSFNDYFWQLLIVNTNKMRTLPLAISVLQDDHSLNMELMMAGAIMASMPILIIYIVLQKYFVQGIKVGSFKK